MKKYFRLYLALAVIVVAFVGCGKNPSGSELEDLLPRSEVRPLEEDMFNLINSARADGGVSALIHDGDLREVAVNHSEDMYNREFFDHENPDGDSVQHRCEDAGIDYNYLGENIARNSGYDNPVAQAHQDLMNSPSHRENILDDEFTHVGVGIASDGEVYYFTQVFAELATPSYYFAVFEVPVMENHWTKPIESFNEAWQIWK